jgi:hypothetical protein
MKKQDIVDTYKKIREALKDDISLSCLHYMYNSALDRMDNHLQPLKMYHINPRDWGMNWYICAVSKQAALDTLVKRFRENAEKEAQDPHSFIVVDARKLYKVWSKATLQNLPQKYTIDEYGEGGIIESDVS